MIDEARRIEAASIHSEHGSSRNLMINMRLHRALQIAFGQSVVIRKTEYMPIEVRSIIKNRHQGRSDGRLAVNAV